MRNPSTRVQKSLEGVRASSLEATYEESKLAEDVVVLGVGLGLEATYEESKLGVPVPRFIPRWPFGSYL